MKKIFLLFTVLTLLTVSCEKEESTVSQNCQSVRCTSITQAGARCSRVTTYCNNRCWQHQ